MKTTVCHTPDKNVNNNKIVLGVHSRELFILSHNHEDSEFVNLVSLDSDIKNRVERKVTAYNPNEYTVMTGKIIIDLDKK